MPSSYSICFSRIGERFNHIDFLKVTAKAKPLKISRITKGNDWYSNSNHPFSIFRCKKCGNFRYKINHLSTYQHQQLQLLLPKNHGISKLVVWRSKRTLLQKVQVPLFRRVQSLILRAVKIFFFRLAIGLAWPKPFGCLTQK